VDPDEKLPVHFPRFADGRRLKGFGQQGVDGALVLEARRSRVTAKELAMPKVLVALVRHPTGREDAGRRSDSVFEETEKAQLPSKRRAEGVEIGSHQGAVPTLKVRPVKILQRAGVGQNTGVVAEVVEGEDLDDDDIGSAGKSDLAQGDPLLRRAPVIDGQRQNAPRTRAQAVEPSFEASGQGVGVGEVRSDGKGVPQNHQRPQAELRIAFGPPISKSVRPQFVEGAIAILHRPTQSRVKSPGGRGIQVVIHQAKRNLGEQDCQ
jgi:hypothetical protein